MNLEYIESPVGISASMLQGFFEGWKRPVSPDQHREILRGSDAVVLAFDMDSHRVVGFITCLTDGIQSAFIPLLEVLPELRGQGIGTELVRRMLTRIERIPAVDLVCDPELQPFYRRFGLVSYHAMIQRKPAPANPE